MLSLHAAAMSMEAGLRTIKHYLESRPAQVDQTAQPLQGKQQYRPFPRLNDVKLKSDQVFVDLRSGVGNVVEGTDFADLRFKYPPCANTLAICERNPPTKRVAEPAASRAT